jgi:hypothetical protein
MTIADWLKDIQFLKERLVILQNRIKQTEWVRLTQKVVSAWATTNIVEQTEFTISPKELMAEYDSTSKNLRLLSQAIEKANHSTEIDFTTNY